MPQAILSVYDKTGIVEFALGLQELGWSLIASGGTARELRRANVEVLEVSKYTASPEVLGGRVKTLHPAIHAGILARSIDADHEELHSLGWEMIRLVAVNLYPFQQTISRPDTSVDEAIENIDIGGVSLIRAAAKNHQFVTLVCDPVDYPRVLDEIRAGGVTAQMRRLQASKGFALTSGYDAVTADYISRLEDHGTSPLYLKAYPSQKLRYGENPHQSAALYAWNEGDGALGGNLLQGKELSYNNLLDLDAAWRAVLSFDKPTICIVKHLSPCGIASATELVTAFHSALASDPVSAFGAVIAANVPFDGLTAEALGELFVECIVAPGFSKESRQLLSSRGNCRLLEISNNKIDPAYDLRSIMGGLLRQEIDLGDPASLNELKWHVASKREPGETEWTSLRFAWKACQHVKSNAIVLTQSEATVGISGGQPNRVDCVRIAAGRAGERAIGASMASDGFFPFADSVQLAAEVGVTAIVQPGGSVRDAEIISAADAAGIAMVTTGVRHFRH